MPGRESGRSRVPGPGPQQAPRETARTNQHIDGQAHHQARIQQPTQLSGPGRSLLLLRFPQPTAQPDPRTLGSQGWQSAQPAPRASQHVCSLPRGPSPELAGLAIGPSRLCGPDAIPQVLKATECTG